MLCKKIQNVIDESEECLCAADEKDCAELCRTFHEYVATEIYKVYLQKGGRLSLLRQAVGQVVERNTTDLPMPPLPIPTEELHLKASTSTADVAGEPAAGEPAAASSQAIDWEWRFMESGRDVISVVQIQETKAPAWNGYRHFFSLNETWRFRTDFASWYSKTFHGSTLPLLREWDFASAHVLRRSSYKGQQQFHDVGLKLPVDSASLPGHVACIAGILQNRGCTKPAYDAAWNMLDVWDRHLAVDRSFPLLPHVIGSDVHVRNNRIRMQELQAAFQAVEMQSYMGLFQKYFPNDTVEVTLGKLLFVMLCARSHPTLRSNEDFQRCTKRTVHVWCQSVHRRMLADDTPLLSQCPDPGRCGSYHPMSREARRKGSPAMKMHLLSRFAAKGGGYVTTAGELSLHELGLVSETSRVAGRVAGEFVMRYLAKLSGIAQDVRRTAQGSSEPFVLNLALDASRVAKQQVLALHFKLDHRHGDMVQVLPDSHPCHDGKTTLAALNTAVDAALGVGPDCAKELRKMGKHLKTYRGSTKALIHAVRNSIQLLLPDYNFQDSVPDVLLTPAEEGSRYQLSLASREMLDVGNDRAAHFIWNPERRKTAQDFYPRNKQNMVRLVLSADEGTEGFLMYQHLSHHGVHIMFWGDTSHRLHRKQAGAIAQVPEAAALLRRLTKLFRTSRAPWDSSRFGRMGQAARLRLLTALQESDDASMLEAVMAGIARDNCVPLTAMTPERALDLLLADPGGLHWSKDDCKEGRWFAWWDHSKKTDRTWSLQWLSILFSFLEHGDCPDAKSADADEGDVLSDSTNQDKMRSMLSIFKPGRQYMASMEGTCAASENSDLQNNGLAHLRHATHLADGSRTRKLVKQTLASSTPISVLEYINAAEAARDCTCQETLSFHTSLLISWLANVVEIEDYARSYPWKAVLALQEVNWPNQLEELRVEWAFIQVLDHAPRGSALARLFPWTRWQSTRELFIEAESIGFRADHVHSGAVRVLACSLAGWTKANEAPVLQSLQCELMFNDMRDAERRHKKADFTKASNVCCAGIRSSWNRSPAESVHLNNLDWVEDEGFKALRAQVLNASRQNDKQLGISLQSLISDRNCSHLTKPHVFCERLRLYRSLLAFFAKKTCNQQEVQRRVDDAWPSALLGPGCVWLFDNKWFLILKTSQYFVRCLELKMKEASPEAKLFVFESCNVWDSMDVRLEGQSFGLACPCVLEDCGLALQVNNFLTLPEYFCRHTILTVAAGTALQYCKWKGIKAAAKANHRERVRMILTDARMDGDYIRECCESVPVKEKKKKEGLNESDGDDEEEDDLADELDYMNEDLENNDDHGQAKPEVADNAADDTEQQKNEEQGPAPVPADGHAGASSRQAVCSQFFL
ncbi:unnamed protein product [Symbiodinium sp. KB8]|nr:unnamed protein product [Symbiodinium sp. KB8]